MDGTINKGVILSIEGNTAKVAPMKDTRLVSPNIQIADNIDAATLKKAPPWLMSASRTTPALYLQH